MIHKNLFRFLQIIIISFFSIKGGFCETSSYSISNGNKERFITVSLKNGMYSAEIEKNNNGYRAAFKTNDNNWYESTGNSWVFIENSNLIENLNTKLNIMKNETVLKCSSGNQIIYNAGYDSGSIGLGSLSTINTNKGIQVTFPIHGDLINLNNTIANITGGTLFIIINSFGFNDCISLEKSESLYEFEETLYPNGITDDNRSMLLDEMIIWLNKDKSEKTVEKEKNEKQIFLEKLSAVLAESINNDEEFINDVPCYMPKDLYGSNTSPYLTMYLTKIRENTTCNRPVFASQLYLSGKDYNPGDYSSITEFEGSDLAEQAIKYTKESVISYLSFRNSKYFNYSLIESNKDIMFEDTYDEIKKYNNPIPYSENGIDTPESLYFKMQLKVNNSNKKENYEFGDKKGKISGTGTDDLGFLTGCIAMSGLQSSIFDLTNETPAKNLYDYSKNKETIEEDLTTFGSATPQNSIYYSNYQSSNENQLKSLVFKYADLAKISYVISDLDEIRKGDLIFGNDGRYKLGIITAVNKNSENKVTKNNITFVWINHEKEFAEKTTWTNTNFTTETGQNCFSVRRLLKKVQDIETPTYTTASCDVCDCRINSSKIEVGSLYEENQKDITEKWRWIPNTGEYLLLDNIKITVKNAAGMIIPKNENNPLEITLDGAKDRCYDKTETDSGNIYNNYSNNFVVKIYNVHGSLGINYSLAKTSAEASAYKASIVKTPTTTKLEVFTINDQGMLLSGKDLIKLAIRPANSQSAYPGDDLLLQFKALYSLEPELTSTQIESSTKQNNILEMTEADYIAVYDKKMLWRANLYIDEGSNDWNNMHPWNAPASSSIVASDKTKEWWNADWGYNEWNREYDGSQNKNKLADLTPGNGGQVVTLPVFTPLRTISDTVKEPDNQNTLSRTVAYSFPSHETEPIQTSEPGKGVQAGDSGSMDSPFDFIWKMMKQKDSLAQSYNSSARDLSLEDNNAWKLTTAPLNQWKKYKVGASDTQMFIPSLGLFYWTSSFIESGITPKTNLSYWNWENTFEAGTDCVGFAQRAASYSESETTQTYLWYKLPEGIMDNGTIDYQTVLKGYGVDNHVRNYPSDSVEANASPWWVHVADDIIAKDALALSTTAHLEALRRVVPGDIWVKDSIDAPPGKLGDKDDLKRNHIAIVAYVPPNADELSVTDLMNAIILIEAEYTNKIQSVIKKLNVGDYNNGEIPVEKNIYPEFSVTDQSSKSGNQGIDLNCQSWAIRRLKCE